MEFENFVFIFNSDLSGNVLIKREYPKMEFEVPGSYIIRFVVEYAKNKEINRLRNMRSEDILKNFRLI
jgi:hypothetical protein